MDKTYAIIFKKTYENLVDKAHLVQYVIEGVVYNEKDAHNLLAASEAFNDDRIGKLASFYMYTAYDSKIVEFDEVLSRAQIQHMLDENPENIWNSNRGLK